MIDALKTGNGVCDVAAGGVDISEDRLAVGVAFSFPTLRGGYKIMVQAEETSTDYWLFFAAFSWELWVAIVGTSIAVGVIVFAAERWAWIRRPRTKPQFPGLQERVWQALGRPMQVWCRGWREAAVTGCCCSAAAGVTRSSDPLPTQSWLCRQPT